MEEMVKSKDIVMEKVEGISAVTEENSAATEEVAATAQNLSQIAMNLMETVNRFKV